MWNITAVKQLTIFCLFSDFISLPLLTRQRRGKTERWPTPPYDGKFITCVSEDICQEFNHFYCESYLTGFVVFLLCFWYVSKSKSSATLAWQFSMTEQSRQPLDNNRPGHRLYLAERKKCIRLSLLWTRPFSRSFVHHNESRWAPHAVAICSHW